MNKVSTLSMYALIFSLSACSTVKTLQATGGSKSDGVVELSYEYGMFENPQVDFNQGLEQASSRCQAWGYTTAQAFGGSTSQCQRRNGYGNCVQELVTVKYQCLD